MRILAEARFLSAAPRSSIARYLRELVEAWAELGDGPSVTLYGPGPRPGGLRTNDRIIWRSPPARISVVGRQAERGRLWLNSFFTAMALLDRPDVIFFPWPFVPYVLRSPAVVTMHDLCFRLHPNHYPDQGHSLDVRARAAAHAAQEVIAVSHSCGNAVSQTYGIDPSRITVVHHGISRLFTHEPTSRDGLLSGRYGLRRRYLLCVSTHEPRKNLETIIKAFGVLIDNRLSGTSDTPMLVLVGRKSDFTRRLLAGLPRSPRLEAALLFLEGMSDDELAGLYRGAEAVVVPSLCEGFGFPLLEAVFSGTPVVASDLSVFRELVGDVCLYVPPTDVTAWTEALVEVLAKRSELHSRTCAVAQQLRDRYSWRSASIQTLEVLNRVGTGATRGRK